MCVCVLLGPVPHLDPDRCYVERILPIGVLRRGRLFLYHFWPMVPVVSIICVLEGVMFGVFLIFDWFPNRIIISFKVRNGGSKGCFPHFMKCRFNFIACLVK